MEEVTDFLLPHNLGSYKRGVVDVESFKRLKEFVDRGFDRFGIPKTMNNRRRLNQRKRKRAPKRKYGVKKRTVRPSSTNMVGHAVGTSTAKRCITNQTWSGGTNLNVPLLYDALINDIPQVGTDVTSAVELNVRQRGMVNLLGFDFRYYVQNNGASAALQVNWAIISPKSGTAIAANDFFRGYGVSRGEDFNAVNHGADILNMSPINRDNYIVMHQESMVLGPSADVTTGANDMSRRDNNYKQGKVWIPINRQIRFTGVSGNDVQDPIFLVYWGCPLGWIPGTPYAAMDFRSTCIAYFKEPGVN